MKIQLIDFNGISNHLGLFYAWWLGESVLVSLNLQIFNVISQVVCISLYDTKYFLCHTNNLQSVRLVGGLIYEQIYVTHSCDPNMTLGQSKPGRIDNERVLDSPLSSRTGASPPDAVLNHTKDIYFVWRCLTSLQWIQSGWLVGLFYGVSTLFGFFNAELNLRQFSSV